MNKSLQTWKVPHERLTVHHAFPDAHAYHTWGSAHTHTHTHTHRVVSVSEDARHTLFLARWRYTGSAGDVLELPSVKAKVHRTCFVRWMRKRRVLRTTFRPNSECKVPNSGSAICSTDLYWLFVQIWPYSHLVFQWLASDCTVTEYYNSTSWFLTLRQWASRVFTEGRKKVSRGFSFVFNSESKYSDGLKLW